MCMSLWTRFGQDWLGLSTRLQETRSAAPLPDGLTTRSGGRTTLDQQLNCCGHSQLPGDFPAANQTGHTIINSVGPSNGTVRSYPERYSDTRTSGPGGAAEAREPEKRSCRVEGLHAAQSTLLKPLADRRSLDLMKPALTSADRPYGRLKRTAVKHNPRNCGKVGLTSKARGPK